MPFDEPRWWYRPEPTLPARLLAPLSCIYGWEAKRRYLAKAPQTLGLPVICIGNFTAGGTGKTPLALYIAKTLQALGTNPAFLSRGYKARHTAPHWVDPGRDTAADAGDEPLLLARAAPTMISVDRAAGAQAIVLSSNGHGAIIMDDGLQNPALAKTLTIAVVDGERGFGNGRVIPAGPLRAPLGFQMPLADAIVVNAPANPTDRTAATLTWLRQHFTGPVLRATPRPTGSTQWLAEKPVLAFCGIGAPDRFFNLLESLGAQLAAKRAFPDHHPIGKTEAQSLLSEAENRQATLVTTEKDWVRLADSGPPGALKAATRTLPIALVFDPSDETVLAALLRRSLARAAPERS
ncbi:MAG: tetraacyldisaccharide 4'-kinase [Hyphomicrobiaceae bacterium]